MILMYYEYGCYSAFCKPKIEDVKYTEDQENVQGGKETRS